MTLLNSGITPSIVPAWPGDGWMDCPDGNAQLVPQHRVSSGVRENNSTTTNRTSSAAGLARIPNS
ncbi:hypothetical protein DAPPUDRAFT_264262 [Daphnia pulex]|uniref:Uncharacterized protein n=1 Tax=Daphnia pulex TaxID=6669 RepID=E9HR83_DAPPU|nr:hypothetical protein DAPPUDRAFT_264262 [Daphnia pulex]|eukprot:EFX65739.1 hypothetical protein DAPPUDRAFT_264262 [Daphnia pulex]